MGVPEFYLNSLPDYRRETLEFMLSIRQYALEKKNPPDYEHLSPLPPKYHPKFSSDIGDAVLLYALQFNQQRDFAIEVNTVAKIMQHEQSTEVPELRDRVLQDANEYILRNNKVLFVDKPSTTQLEFRSYLLFFVNQYCDARKYPKAEVDKYRESIASPAMNQLRKLIEYYAMRLHHLKDTKSYIQFYACICVLLMRMDDMKLNDFLFQVLGEAENVIFKYENSFPGYVNLDNFAKFEKLLLSGKVQQISD